MKRRSTSGVTREVRIWGMAVLVAVVGTGGCTGDDGGEDLTVLAAASLTDAFTELAARFETSTGTDVTLSFAGSSTLRESILEGAPADVFASADPENMDAVADAGELARPPEVFARNVLELAVPPGNPGSVDGVEDLARDELFVGLCAPPVPCGGLARTMLANEGVEAAVDSEEPDVRALLTKLEAGELEVGVVYRSDVVAADGRVAGITIPDDVAVETEYSVGVLASADEDAAVVFVDFMRSALGVAVLERWGFEAP